MNPVTLCCHGAYLASLNGRFLLCLFCLANSKLTGKNIYLPFPSAYVLLSLTCPQISRALIAHLLIILLLLVLSQGLRKSSDCGRVKRTVMPHSVPHMVQLKKFIVSEDAVFLLLQYAEGKSRTCSSVSSFFPGTPRPPSRASFLSDLVSDRCLIEMGVCHRSLF